MLSRSHAGPSGHPERGVQRRAGSGVGGAVELTEQVALGVAARLDAGAAPEALLDPPHGGERSAVLDQDPLGVGDGDRVVGADLQQQVTAGPGRLEPVDAERRQVGDRCRPPVVDAGRPVEAGPEAEGHGQPCRQQPEFGLGVGQRGSALGEPGGVVGEQPQHPAQRGPVGAGAAA